MDANRVRSVLLEAVNSGKWSRRSLALAAGLGDTAVRDIIRNPGQGCTLETATALAKALGGTVDSVFGDDACPKCGSAKYYDHRYCICCGHGVGQEPQHAPAASLAVERQRRFRAKQMFPYPPTGTSGWVPIDEGLRLKKALRLGIEGGIVTRAALADAIGCGEEWVDGLLSPAVPISKVVAETLSRHLAETVSVLLDAAMKAEAERERVQNAAPDLLRACRLVIREAEVCSDAPCLSTVPNDILDDVRAAIVKARS